MVSLESSCPWSDSPKGTDFGRSPRRLLGGDPDPSFRSPSDHDICTGYRRDPTVGMKKAYLQEQGTSPLRSEESYHRRDK